MKTGTERREAVSWISLEELWRSETGHRDDEMKPNDDDTLGGRVCGVRGVACLEFVMGLSYATWKCLNLWASLNQQCHYDQGTLVFLISHGLECTSS